jgi:O-antigen/teichoic acid export membrane protein
MEDNSTDTSSHQSILKATGVFGFLQILKLIISVITSKFVAVFLGPYGIGLVSLLTNAASLISSITSFESLKVGTREIALHSAEDDTTELSKSIQNLQRIALLVGVFGALVSILFSETLSNFIFGSSDKKQWFYVLGIYFVITGFANARMAILQGVNQIKTLAWCNIIIAFFTAIGSVLMYYYLKMEGIIWVVLYTSVVTLLVTTYFTKHYTFQFSFTNLNEFIKQSSPIMKLGFVLSINLILGQICFFIIRLYLNEGGASSSVLGFYQVNTIIIVNYLGLIFNAMSYDFYPKLTAIHSEPKKVNELVNSQIEIALLLVTPAIIFLYIFGPFLIEILFTKEFRVTFFILKLAVISVVLKSISMPMAYLILAKGDRWQYFKQELLGDVLNVTLTIFLYQHLGLEGIGLAYIVNYTIYGVYVYYVVKTKYYFAFHNQCFKLIKVSVLLAISGALIVIFVEDNWSTIVLSILLLLSVFFSYTELNKRVSVFDYIKTKLGKFKR